MTKIKELVAAGTGTLLIATPSFTGEHIENMHEIDIELKRDLVEEGIGIHFSRVTSPPDTSVYFDAMAEMVGAWREHGVVHPGRLVENAEAFVNEAHVRETGGISDTHGSA